MPAPGRGAFCWAANALSSWAGASACPSLEAVDDLHHQRAFRGRGRPPPLRPTQGEPRLRALSVGLWEQISEGALLAGHGRLRDGLRQRYGQPGSMPARPPARSMTPSPGSSSISPSSCEIRLKLLTAMAYPVLIAVIALRRSSSSSSSLLLPRLESAFRGPCTGRCWRRPSSSSGSRTLSCTTASSWIAALPLAAVSFWRWRTTAGCETSYGWLLLLPLVGPFLVTRTPVFLFSLTFPLRPPGERDHRF